jgi:hypothetical protein
MFCAEQARAKSSDASTIAGEEMEIFSIPGRLIVPEGSLCQCSSEIFWRRLRESAQKKPVLCGRAPEFLAQLSAA